MAIDPSSEYPGKITAPDADYDYGSAKSATTPTAQDGTPWSIKLVNDIFGLQQKLLKLTGIVPSGNSETQLVSQYYQALSELIGRLNYGEDAVNTNNYVVTTINEAPSLKKGYRILLLATNANTGASDINPNGLGVTDIKLRDGSATPAGAIPALELVELIYDGTNFVLQGLTLLHDHGDADNGGNLGVVQATNLTLTGAAPAAPVADRLYKDNICSAWVRFNGNAAPAIADDFNVSGIIRNSQGQWTVTIDTDLDDANYAAIGGCGDDNKRVATCHSYAVGSVDVTCRNVESTSSEDDALMSVHVFGGR